MSRLPFSLKVLLENLLRHEDGVTVTADDIKGLARWNPRSEPDREIAFRPSRVLLQDFTGVPAIVDLAAMRDAMKRLGGNPRKINPLQPVELVIDHSVQVDEAGTPQAFAANAELEFERNQERYAFLRWGQNAFNNFRVVPPDTGIVHQVNLEYLARVVFGSEGAQGATSLAYPDTLVGTDSHTTMINGLGVLGWGVGGIEAEAAMLGQPVSMLVPQVVGFKLTGSLPEGATATDLVLTVTQMLRKRGVVGKFVEYFGNGLAGLPLADRATIANMAPEYGATCGLFPIDAETIRYLELSGRPPAAIKLVEAYAKAQGMYHSADSPEAEYSDTLELDLSTVEPSLAGPRRPQDRVPLHDSKTAFQTALKELQSARPKKKASSCVAAGDRAVRLRGRGYGDRRRRARNRRGHGYPRADHERLGRDRGDHELHQHVEPVGHGRGGPARQEGRREGAQDQALGQGQPGARLEGRHRLSPRRGARQIPRPASLQPGRLRLHDVHRQLGTACPGRSARRSRSTTWSPSPSCRGNRNFEGRINPDVRANYLASPPLVVAYALAGTMDIDLQTEPLGSDRQGKPVYLKDIWPSQREIADTILKSVRSEMFQTKYAEVFEGDERWSTLPVPKGDLYEWDPKSTYVKNPPYFLDMKVEPAPVAPIVKARVLAVLGDSITTDHISPAGSIKPDSPAGRYLIERGVSVADFNSYGARRGNDEVMVRGTFANIRLREPAGPGYRRGLDAASA